MAISPQQLTIYLYSAHRAVILAIAQLSCYIVWLTVLQSIDDDVSAVTSSAMKSVTSRPSSCTVLKPPPSYGSYVTPSVVPAYPADTSPSLTGYRRPEDDDDAKSRRRSRVCARSPGSAPPPTMAAKSRRSKRSSSGAEHVRRHQQLLQQSYVTAAARRQLSVTDCHGWSSVDSAYPQGTDYAAAAAACHPAAEVASCRYQTTPGAVRPPYRHDLLAVVPAIGPGETGPAAERLKQMAAHYQRVAATADSDGSSGGGVQSSSFAFYDERYPYELYDEFAAQCQRFAVQPHYQQQSLYYDQSSYGPMVADTTHGYLSAACNGLSQTPVASTRSQYALQAEPEAISASQFSYNGGLAGNMGYAVSDVRYMSPCAQQTTTVTTMSSQQAPVSLYSSTVASASACQPTVVSTAIQTPMCFAAEPQTPVDNYLDIYSASTSLTMSTSSSSSTTSTTSSRRASLAPSSSSSAPQLAPVAAPVFARSPWSMAGDSGAWLTGQVDGLTTSPDVGVEATSFGDSAPRRLDVKPIGDAELFSRQSTVGRIELY